MSLIIRLLMFIVLVGAFLPTLVSAQTGIDPEALIERIVAADRGQRDQIKTITWDAEYVEWETDSDTAVEKVRFVKKVFVKNFEDTAWFAVKYLEYYHEGHKQSDAELRSEAASREDKRIKRKAHDISYPMLSPFYPDNRAAYNIDYLGVSDERLGGHVCHQFRVTAKVGADGLINGDFFFEADNFRVVQVDFSPSKLIKKLMFKLEKLNMSVQYGPTAGGFWLPQQFDIQGKGKAAFFFGVNFTGTEYYRNPVINEPIDDSVFQTFEAKDDD